MPWTCKNCAFDANVDGTPQCQGCLSFRMPRRIVLTGAVPAQQLGMSINTQVGRRLLKAIAGDDSQYASEPQFEIVRDDVSDAWLIHTASSATNPTFYNGESLGTEPECLTDGGVISIGAERMKLTVKFEY